MTLRPGFDPFFYIEFTAASADLAPYLEKKNAPVMGHLVQKARVVVWLIKYPSYQWVFHIRGKGFAHSWLKNRRTTMVIKNDHKTVYQSSMIIIRYTDTHLY